MLEQHSEVLCLLLDANIPSFSDLTVEPNSEKFLFSVSEHCNIIENFIESYGLFYPFNILIIVSYDSKAAYCLFNGFARSFNIDSFIEKLYNYNFKSCDVVGPSLYNLGLMKAFSNLQLIKENSKRILHISLSPLKLDCNQIDDLYRISLSLKEAKIKLDAFVLHQYTLSVCNNLSLLCDGLTLGLPSPLEAIINEKNVDNLQTQTAIIGFLLFHFMNSGNIRETQLTTPIEILINTAYCDCHQKQVKIGYLCMNCFKCKFMTLYLFSVLRKCQVL